MTAAADRLIVALDLLDADADYLCDRLIAETSVRFFKLNAAMLLQPEGWRLAEKVGRLIDDTGLFLDLKCYDTRDTVYNIARRAFDLGARFLTVHATPSMLEAAMRAKPPGDRAKVLAVAELTDSSGCGFLPSGASSDGLVCSVAIARDIRSRYKGTIVCPGIRLRRGNESPWAGFITDPDNHSNPATPTEAIRAGADYIVVGRPITQAPDPVAPARAIITEIEEATR